MSSRPEYRRISNKYQAWDTYITSNETTNRPLVNEKKERNYVPVVFNPGSAGSKNTISHDFVRQGSCNFISPLLLGIMYVEPDSKQPILPNLTQGTLTTNGIHCLIFYAPPGSCPKPNCYNNSIRWGIVDTASVE